MRRIIIMMKAIIGAAYLCRADAEAPSWPLYSQSRSQMVFASNTYTCVHICAHASHSLT